MKETQNHQYWQQKEEKGIIDSFLDEIDIPPYSRHYSDKPDVWVDMDNRKIGIEITQIKATDNIKTQAALYKIFEEYNQHIAKITTETYQISVLFQNVDYPNDVNLRLHKEEIFKEIDSFIPGHKPIFKRKFIDEALFIPSPGIDTFTSEVVVLESKDLKTKDLLECIAKKESKLKNYKHLTNYDEYWLVINFPFIEQTDFRKFEATNINSEYNRIYLVEIGSYKRIK